MKILHLGDSRGYCQRFAVFVNKHFNESEHDFILSGLGRYSCTKEKINLKNVKYIKWKIPDEIIQLYKIPFTNYDKIILHGLFNWRVFFPFPFKNIDMAKVYWKFWGADLYFYRYRNKNFRDSFIELIRRKNIRKIRHIIAGLKAEYELAKKIYNTPAKHHYGFYPNIINHSMLDSVCNVENKGGTILLGNSADPSNNHLEVLKCLKSFENKDFRIICPLSYGNKKYAEEVAKYGNEKFGKKFQPLFNYIDSKEYASLLASVDVGIFNHQRQQALGTIKALLYLGRKVYIRSDTIIWNYFKEMNIGVFDTTTIFVSSFHDLFKIDNELNKKNRGIIKKEFSEEKCASQWENIFYQ